MSAIRSTATRRSSSRSSHTPYARPTEKKSSWNILEFFSFLNPLHFGLSRDTTSDALPDLEDEDDSTTFGLSAAAESLSQRGQQMAQQLSIDSTSGLGGGPSSGSGNNHDRPPRSVNNCSIREEQTSNSDSPNTHPPHENIEAVKEFLTGKAGTAISEVEVKGLVSLLENSIPAERTIPFRFSSNKASTSRGISPVSIPNNLNSDASVSKASEPRPRKTLARNPNGRYRWLGGGSAKLPSSRNRYYSPAFGPSRSTSDRLILKESQDIEDLTADTKRRRVGQDVETSFASSSGSGTKMTNGRHSPSHLPRGSPLASDAPNPSRTDGAPLPKQDQVRVPPLLRLSQKPTAPIVPSPLRQAWTGSSSIQNNSTCQPSRKQTKAASFMAVLIKEVSPPKRPDLSNPYQTANPAGKVAPRRKPKVAKRVRTARASAVKAEEAKGTCTSTTEINLKEASKQYSPQAIIEATLPKGCKRSRPSVDEDASGLCPEKDSGGPCATDHSATVNDPEKAPGLMPSPSSGTNLAEGENEANENSQMPKTNCFEDREIVGFPDLVKKTAGQVTEKVEIVGKNLFPNVITTNAGASAMNPFSIQTNRPTPSTFKPASAPKEPSKLRFSYRPEANASPSTEGTSMLPVTKKEDIKSKVKQTSVNAKEAALSLSVESLPAFVLSFSSSVTPPVPMQYSTAQEEAKSLAISLLPVFELTAQMATSETVASAPIM